MNLYIVSASKTERVLLCEAFLSQDFTVELHDNIDSLPVIGADDFFIISVVPKDVEQVKSFANQYPVFVICDDEIDSDPAYEEVYVRPLRLGSLVENVSQIITQHKIYKELSPITMGNLTLNPQTSFLKDDDKNIVLRLTEKELAIILFLNNNKNATRDILLKNIWGYKDDIETHTLETHLYRLRQKFQKTFGYNFLITDEDGYHLKFQE